MTTKENKDSVMAKLLEEKQYFNLPKIGELISGTVISCNKNEVHIDLGGVATGIVRGRERYDESDEYKNLKPGDTIQATVLELENENGEVELSFQFAGKQKAWQALRDLETTTTIISATITDANKGGLMVKLENLNGFLPVSQLSPEHYPRIPGGDKNRILEILKGYIGKKFEVKIMDINEEEEKLIVSEKAAWEETQKDVLGKYQVGQQVEGTVTAVTDFGIFVEFDDKLEGLIHISEIAWQRIDNPNDFVKVGQKIKAEIIGIENSKIFLSMKKMQMDPWDGIEKKYKIGQKVKGKVIKINPFGLFVELDKNIHGLAHISQLSDKPIANINDFAKAGDEIDLYIVSMDPRNHRLGLSAVKPKEEKPATEDKKTEEVKTDTATSDTEVKSGEEEKKETKKKKEKATEEPSSAPADAKAIAGKEATEGEKETQEQPKTKSKK
ncbi:MAG: S1 RNA-binding domain-containing protein [Patescibacteria group bacterium]|jgi:ribosomal protein S1